MDPATRSLRRAVHERLLRIGFKKNGHGYLLPRIVTKETIRDFHRLGRVERRSRFKQLLVEQGEELLEHFADGAEVEPRSISPRLVRVRAGTTEAALFRFATLLWSVPVSQGFGRRVRFLVRDDRNGKLIGLFALTDPVFNLSVRDDWIGWTSQERRQRLVRVMDAFVVGAVPPYSMLIGGKLVAALMTSAEVLRSCERKYRGARSVIDRRIKPSRLVLLTTTSALGRSSLYNRLVIPGGASFQSLGRTKGYGHFHLSGHLFDRLREHLATAEHPYASGHRFGMGPNWRLRVARQALHSIGLPADAILRHGIEREVFAAPLSDNWREVLRGQQKRVRGSALTAESIAEYCIQRWMVPRSLRDGSYKDVSRESLRALMQA